MAIYKWVRDIIEKYTFVTKTEMKGSTVFVYYEKNGKEKCEKVAYRSTRNQLQKKIEKIKKDINYEEEKALRDIKVRKSIEEDEKKKKPALFSRA